MIQEYFQRAAFWGTTINCTGGQTVKWDPVALHPRVFELCKGKDVLEIGPGYGEQFNVLRPHARSYAVADISEEVLARPEYADVSRHLLTGYQVDLGQTFDMIHFWRVMHHVLPDEVAPFAAWLHRHVRRDGFVCFDLPGPQVAEDVALDGMKTVPHDPATIMRSFHQFAVRTIDHSFVCLSPLTSTRPLA